MPSVDNPNFVGISGFRRLCTNKNDPEILAEASLEKIINVSDLSTFQAVYNGIAQVMNEKNPEKIDFYVSYAARVDAGIDFEQIDIDVDYSSKVVTVTLPEVKLSEPNVDISSLDYMFVNDKANTSTVIEVAYKACISDVKAESSTENAIFDLARENARNTIKALITPFVSQLDAKFTVVVE